MYFWNVGSGLVYMRGKIWGVVPVKFKRGMYEIKILGSEVLWSIFGILIQDGMV